MRCFAAGLVVATNLLAQQPELQDLLDALDRTASFFARTAPSLGARETLTQRARRANMQVLRRDRHHEIKEIAFTLPETFESHEVVSDYSMGTPAGGAGFHEIRRILEFDRMPPGDATTPVRHAMTLALDDADDEVKKKILEELELDRLEGAATDFGPILLLFSSARQRDTRFSSGGRRALPSGPALVINYRQTAGRGALTEFRNRRETKHMPEGQIWLREDDLLPLRITLSTEEIITPKYLLRNEAEIEYIPTPFGLAPHFVTHRQYVNQDLLVENRFSYSHYRGLAIIP